MKVSRRGLQALPAFFLTVFSSFGTSGETSTNTTHQVKGIVGRWVSFSVKVSPGKQVEKIEWDVINPRSETPYRLCEFRDGKLKKTDVSTWAKALWDKSAEVSMMMRNFTIWAQQSGRLHEEMNFVNNVMLRYMFRERLGVSAGTTLTIRKMEKEDAGIYRARVWFDAEQFEDHIFQLILYELVPSPKIQYNDFIKTSEGCRVTLQCQIYGEGKYNISWKEVRASDNLSVFNSGRNLYVSWRKGSPDSRFTCVASNQVDQEETSIDLLEICRDDEDIPSVTLAEGQYGPPPENPITNLPVMNSAPESPVMSPPSYDDVQVDCCGEESPVYSEPPAYDSIFDCIVSDADTCDCS